jgi:hypothetical protein
LRLSSVRGARSGRHREGNLIARVAQFMQFRRFTQFALLALVVLVRAQR